LAKELYLDHNWYKFIIYFVFNLYKQNLSIKSVRYQSKKILAYYRNVKN